jgi:HEAT repeat protein
MAREVPKALRKWLLLGGLGLAVAGCAHNWDEITGNDFKFRDLYKTPDAMTVLRDNPDGDARAKAMQRLKEPKKHGGTDAQQDEAVAILTRQAESALEPLCRLEAIRALGRFDDPRTTAPLVKAYYNAGNEKNFTPDISNQIRTCALTALGQKNQPEAMALLVQAAAPRSESKPNPVQPVGFDSDRAKPDSDGPAAREIRLAAIRALGKTHNPQAIPVLLPHLSDKDVAVRDEAHSALQSLTGLKNVQPDVQSWQAAMGSQVNLKG